MLKMTLRIIFFSFREIKQQFYNMYTQNPFEFQKQTTIHILVLYEYYESKC